MTPVSIRLRLTGWYSAVLLLGLVLFALVMWFALQQRLLAGADARLSQRLEGLRVMLQDEDAVRDNAHLQGELSEFASQAPGALVQVRDEAGVTILPSGNRQAFAWAPSVSTPMYATVQRNGASFRIAVDSVASAGRTFRVLAANSLDDNDAVMRDFRNLLLIMIPLVLAVACLGGYWLSSRALRPVDEITTVAQSISVHNLARRLAVPRTGDELQRMAEAWNQVLERLDAAVKSIRQFTADASHELRTPLALIKATAELALRRERSPAEYRVSLNAIESEATRMTVLTESLLTLARADGKGLLMPLSPVDLNLLAGAAVQQHALRAAAKEIRLTAETNGSVAVAQANPAGIERVLSILIDNALRHTPNGGRIAVRTHCGHGERVLVVEDDGEGIAPEALPHIFERFYRSDPARGAGSGFGLGLSIAQSIAQAHAACIVVESSPGAGARFSLKLKAGDSFSKSSGS